MLRGLGTLCGHLPPRLPLRRLLLQHVGHEQLQLADARLQRRRPLLRAPPVRLELQDLCTQRLHRLDQLRDHRLHLRRQRAVLRRGGKIAVRSCLGGEPEPARALANEQHGNGEEAPGYVAHTHATLRRQVSASGLARCWRGAPDWRSDAPESAPIADRRDEPPRRGGGVAVPRTPRPRQGLPSMLFQRWMAPGSL